MTENKIKQDKEKSMRLKKKNNKNRPKDKSNYSQIALILLGLSIVTFVIAAYIGELSQYLYVQIISYALLVISILMFIAVFYFAISRPNAKPVQSSGLSICPNCAKHNDNDAKYCTHCGHKLTGAIQNKKHGDNLNSPLIATASSRVVNYALDSAIVIVSAILILDYIARFNLSWLNNYIFSLIIILFYYILFETIFNKTPAKFITRTRVKMINGSKPTIKPIIIRSICRFIPFEIFTFTGQRPIGLHDRLSKTIVVGNK